jgi:DNA repair protein RadC
MILLAGCTTVKIDGQIDPIESLIIKVAVERALVSEPKLAIVAYAVSTALTIILDGSEVTSLDIVNEALTTELNKIELTNTERLLFMSLVESIRMKVIQETGLPEITAKQKIVVIRDIVRAVRDVSFLYSSAEK